MHANYLFFSTSAAGADFNLALGRRSLSKALPRVCIIIDILDDAVIEEDEEFVLVLTADNALSTAAQPNTTNIIIADNDCRLYRPTESLYVNVEIVCMGPDCC